MSGSHVTYEREKERGEKCAKSDTEVGTVTRKQSIHPMYGHAFAQVSGLLSPNPTQLRDSQERIPAIRCIRVMRDGTPYALYKRTTSNSR